MADVNWRKIKAEYITTDVSYSKLAEKYGLNKATIAKKAAAEHWVDLKKQHAIDVLSKTTEKIAEKQAAEYAKVNAVADTLLEKLQQAANEVDLYIVHHKIRTETDDGYDERSYEEAITGGNADARKIKVLASALRDLKEVKDLRCLMDQQEQEARIENLKSRAAQDQDTGAVLTIEGGDRYAN